MLPSPQADTNHMQFVAATMEQSCAIMDCEACERAAGGEQGNSQTRGLPDALDLNSPQHCIAEQTQLEAPGEALALYIVLLVAKSAFTLPCW